MSKETMAWLNANTLIGFTDQRGTAWHYRADLQAAEPNHYAGPVPVEAVKRRLFGWEAIASPVYVENPVTGGLAQAPDRQALIRSDTGHVMGIFSEGYEPHPYSQWLIDTVGLLLDDDLSIGSAGLLREGAVAWVSVEVPDTITTPEGVAFRPHLLACTSFDGSLATTFKRSITNVVCDNTMALALKKAGEQVKIKHSRKSKLRLGKARQALGIIWKAAEDYSAQVAELCRIEVSDRDWNAFLDAHVPLPEEEGGPRTRAGNRRDVLTRLWRWDNRVAPWRGTAYGVVQAVNTHAHHEQTVRGTAVRPERNMLRAVTGEFDELDRVTLRTLLQAIDADAPAFAA